MTSLFSEEFQPLTPINFFQLKVPCRALPSKGVFPYINKDNIHSYDLPGTSGLCGESQFAQVALGWNQEGIEVYVNVSVPFQRAVYPEVSQGDSIELFLDTRDVKTSGFNTRFCHHFFFLAEGVDGVFAGEITHFRTEDVHPLCHAADLKIKVKKQRVGYTLNLFLPAQVLHGYDPEQFKRLGFSYRINRVGDRPQHFSVVTDDYPIEQQPSLWSHLELVSL